MGGRAGTKQETQRLVIRNGTSRAKPAQGVRFRTRPLAATEPKSACAAGNLSRHCGMAFAALWCVRAERGSGSAYISSDDSGRDDIACWEETAMNGTDLVVMLRDVGFLEGLEDAQLETWWRFPRPVASFDKVIRGRGHPGIQRG